MSLIRNPILKGFNPDPSICRVGEDYYIATSTFEWFPGVQIHHSRDLADWTLITRPLNQPSQLNMLGAPDSCGVWAPCHYCWSGEGWGTKAGFDWVHERRGSKVESLDIDLPDLIPEAVGKFDVVLFLGVLYHLKDPFSGLERAAALCNETLIVETAGAMFDCPEPVMRYYLGGELNGDGGNYWAPNAPCLHNMLREIGFTKIEFLEPDGPTRLLVAATR